MPFTEPTASVAVPAPSVAPPPAKNGKQKAKAKTQ